MRRNKLIISIVLVLIAAVATYALNEYSRTHPDTGSLKSVATRSATELVKEFENDETKASENYADKVITVNGQVIKIEKEDTAGKILLGERESMAGVLCEFDNRNSKKLKDLKEGQQVKVKGICTGMLMDVIMVRCVLME